jgi:hypothetical protein
MWKSFEKRRRTLPKCRDEVRLDRESSRRIHRQPAVPGAIGVRRREREELLAVELAQPRRQGFLADETQGEGGHGIGQRQMGCQCTAMAAVNAIDRSSSGWRRSVTRMDTAFQAEAHQSAQQVRLPQHERRTARALLAEIKAVGYSGGYLAVTDFIRAWRQGVARPPLSQPSCH